MEHRALGRSGVEVSRIILGCGNFGGLGSSPAHFGAGETEGEAHALMDAAWEAGITTFDTADAYGGGRSESYIGSWLRAKGADVRDRIVLTTKTFNPMSDGADHGLSPRADPPPARRQPGAPRCRVGPALPRPRDGSGRAGRRDDRRVRRSRRRGEDPGLRRQQRRCCLARGGAASRPAGLGAERVLAARPRGRGGHDRGVHAAKGSASRRSARSPAAGSRASTGAPRSRRRDRG